MIEDIGTKGLRVLSTSPRSHIYDQFNKGQAAIIGEAKAYPLTQSQVDSMGLTDVVDVTTMHDMERKFIPAFSCTESIGPH